MFICYLLLGIKIDDGDSALAKYDLLEIMQANMKDVHLCSAISFALAILSLKRNNILPFFPLPLTLHIKKN